MATAEALPADRGVAVALLVPQDDVFVRRVWTIEGLRVVAPSQLAVDCLAGNGRQPAEGEALTEWMQAHEESWRSGSLAALGGSGR